MELIDYVAVALCLMVFAVPLTIKAQDDKAGKVLAIVGGNLVISNLYCIYIFLDKDYGDLHNFFQDHFYLASYSWLSFFPFIMVFLFGEIIFRESRISINVNASPESLRKLADEIEKGTLE